MQYPPKKLSQNERAALQSWLVGQAGTRSYNVTKRSLIDTTNKVYDMGGEIQSVHTNELGIPIVVTEQFSKVLDCGHAIKSLDQIGGMSSNGDIVCNRHKLTKCSVCGRVNCDHETEWAEGKPVCSGGHESSISPLGILMILLVVIVLILKYVISK